ncbi:MAG: glycoside hydrolase family 92 protein, partial [Candidatus Eisenbacteria bacterium]|nr:glycoside hydrolase family 92 protein [Candidatus Eisenbacteria bacterium]
VGDPGTVNVSNAYAMGVRGFDTEKALALMLKSANDPEHTQRWGLEDWIEKHYCAGNAAITLEYALADFTIAQYAQALGRPDLARQFLKRSAYWKESWNPTDGYVEPRGGSGDEAARIYEVQVFGPGGAKENFALGRPATASSSCNDRETPDKAVNGTWDGGLGDKWCDNESEHKWWRVDLGERRTLGRFEIYHAQMGGESSAWNTRDFKIQGSDDDATWTDLVTVRGNRDSLTVHEIAPIKARYVRLDLTPAEADTGWGCQPFDRASGCGFVEGNAAQYVWMVPHDLEGLFQLMGGRATAVTRLDDLFQELNAGIGRPYFYIGNEPEHGTPWIYNFAQAPAKTQAVVRRIVDQEFLPDPGGLPGNDDLGATSAWLTWAYLGMFPAIPGTDIMVLHGPYFPRAQVTLANGNVLTIEGEGAGPNAPYVQSLTIDGKDTTKSWLRYADIAHGATLHFVMGGTPSPSWGRGAGDVPPSFPAR